MEKLVKAYAFIVLKDAVLQRSLLLGLKYSIEQVQYVKQQSMMEK